MPTNPTIIFLHDTTTRIAHVSGIHILPGKLSRTALAAHEKLSTRLKTSGGTVRLLSRRLHRWYQTPEDRLRLAVRREKRQSRLSRTSQKPGHVGEDARRGAQVDIAGI